MKRYLVFGLSPVLILAALVLSNSNLAHAQIGGLAVMIIRPAEGETVYTSAAAPYARVPVTCRVAAASGDVQKVQVKFEILQGAKSLGSETAAPQADGTVTFQVGINPKNPDVHAVTECSGAICHNNTPLGFPPGRVLLRVTASDQSGQQAIAERAVSIDQSGNASVPVRVVFAGNSNQSVPSMTVTAATRLYDWRGRNYSSKTDAKGVGQLYVEALALEPTHYVLQVQPAIVDGVLYKGKEPIEVTIPTGAMTMQPVTLVAESQLGRIEGSLDSAGVPSNSELSNNDLGVSIRAINLASGASYTTKVVNGHFTFTDLRLAQYLLAVEEGAGVQAAPQSVDLSASPLVLPTLKALTSPRRPAHGTVRDTSDSPLPFAWVAANKTGPANRVSPASGEFSLDGLNANARTLWVSAPGYYGQPIARGLDGLNITLTPLPDTRRIAWGAGAIILPPQALSSLDGNHLTLKHGWVWGSGSGQYSISTPDLDLQMSGGSFALECYSDATSWVYQLGGQARVTVAATGEQFNLSQGQMLAFGRGVTRSVAVTMDEAAVRYLHSGESSPVAVELNSSPLLSLRDSIEQLGIPFVPALLIVFLVVLLALGGGLWRRHSNSTQNG